MLIYVENGENYTHTSSPKVGYFVGRDLGGILALAMMHIEVNQSVSVCQGGGGSGCVSPCAEW